MLRTGVLRTGVLRTAVLRLAVGIATCLCLPFEESAFDVYGE